MVAALAPGVFAQDTVSSGATNADRFEPSTRAAQIEAARDAKAAALSPDTPQGLEHALDIFEDKQILQRITYGIAGWRVHMGGLVTGSGFAAGPEYYRHLVHNQLSFRASLRASIKRYYLMDDAKSINSLDSVVEENGVRFVKHFLIDFGASLGSDSFEAKNPRRGNVYVFSWESAAIQFLSLGTDVPGWMRADYPDLPAVGNFESKRFDPRRWHANYPNPAFELHNPGDAYWGAKKVMAFSDEAIRAIVHTGQFSDPRAEEWIARCLIERRDKIGRAFFEYVLPLDHFAVQGGKLAFEDLAVRYGFHAAPVYSIQWYEFDNRTGAKTPIAGSTSFEVPHIAAPYLAATIQAGDPHKTVTVYLHDNAIVGIDRTW